MRKRIAPHLSSQLRMRANELASGWAAGSHRAARRGSGIEFAGHRDYCPGDDLRHLDRHALLRHGRHLIRQFHTDTDRAVHLVLDATPSMYFSQALVPDAASSPGESKLERALILAAALTIISRRSGDSVGLSWLGDEEPFTFAPRGGKEATEQIFYELEKVESRPPRTSNREKMSDPPDWHTFYTNLGSLLPRGTIIFVLSDFLDMSPEVKASLAALCTMNRTVRAAQILTPDEIEFPFEGVLRLRNPETGVETETEGRSVQAQYQKALRALTSDTEKTLASRGGMLIRSSTRDEPMSALRQLTKGLREGSL